MTPTENETLTKQEFLYLQTIDKQNVLLEHLKQQNESNKGQAEKLRMELESIKSEHHTLIDEKKTLIAHHKEEKSKLDAEIKSLKAEVEEEKGSADDLQAKCQEYCDASEHACELLEIENRKFRMEAVSLRRRLTTPQDKLFLNMCKGDLVLAELGKHKNVFTHDELLENDFPPELLDGDKPFEGITSSNHILIKNPKTNNYELTQI